MPRWWYFAACFLCLWKLTLPHLESILKIILKISQKSICNNNWWSHHINKFDCALHTLKKKYLVFFLRRNIIQIDNSNRQWRILSINNFIKCDQTANFIDKSLIQQFNKILRKCTKNSAVLTSHKIWPKDCCKLKFDPEL